MYGPGTQAASLRLRDEACGQRASLIMQQLREDRGRRGEEALRAADPGERAAARAARGGGVRQRQHPRHRAHRAGASDARALRDGGPAVLRDPAVRAGRQALGEIATARANPARYDPSEVASYRGGMAEVPGKQAKSRFLCSRPLMRIQAGDVEGGRNLMSASKGTYPPQKPSLQMRDLGGAVQPFDPTTGQAVGPAIPKTMSPGEREASARGWAGLGETKRHHGQMEGLPWAGSRGAGQTARWLSLGQ